MKHITPTLMNDEEKNEKHIIRNIDELDSLEDYKVLTGMRPSGKLHLGHYFWAMTNWLMLQNKMKCQFLIADYHVLGERVEEIDRLKQNVLDVAMDWLSVWLDPEKSDFVIQSYVPEGAELNQFLSMLTPYSKLEQNPTLKHEMKQLRESGDTSSMTAGFFGYPISQAADILLPKANLVPVWEDQIPHIELTRFLARKFNRQFGKIFSEPCALLSPVSRLVWIDGKEKMSKTLGNTIMLSDDTETVKKQVMKMYTDPTRIRATDPGHIEWNVVFTYLDIFEKNLDILNEFKEQYKAWKIGDVTLKNHLFDLIESFLVPIREKRFYYEAHPEIVRQAIETGSMRARVIAKETMNLVKSSIGIDRY